jgi:hypothetical protein
VPDLFSFGPFFLTHLPLIARRWTSRERLEPPDPSIIPGYVYHSYNVTHSLVVWAAAFATCWWWKRHAERGMRNSEEGVLNRNNHLPHSEFRIPHSLWPFFAWPLHILCDIPTHSTQFFPTPFLWPLTTPFVNGRPWSRPPFMAINYGLIALTYLGVTLFKRRRRLSA